MGGSWKTQLPNSFLGLQKWSTCLFFSHELHLSHLILHTRQLTSPTLSYHMGQDRVYTLSQVAQHKSSKDCWLVVYGRVLNVTKFLEEHPGGEEVLLEVAGKDATKEFDTIGHSDGAKNMLSKFQVGVLQGHTIQELHGKDDVANESTKKEMSAFVIKDDSTPKFKALFDFFLPFLAASLYFGYRYISRSDQIAY